jgi:hypothetical protein
MWEGRTYTNRPRALRRMSLLSISLILSMGFPSLLASRNSVPMEGVESKWAYWRRSNGSSDEGERDVLVKASLRVLIVVVESGIATGIGMLEMSVGR